MSTDTLTLDVEDRPSIERGDVLAVTPDVGMPYRAHVQNVDGDDDRLKARIPGDRHAPHPVPPQSRTFHRDDLEAFYVTGDLLINPPPLPDPPRGAALRRS